MIDLQNARGRTALIDRVVLWIFLTAMLTWCVGARPAAATDLYGTKVTVTGQGEPNRTTGFAAALEDVLIKASGAEKLNGDRRLAAYKPKAKDFVKSFSSSRRVLWQIHSRRAGHTRSALRPDRGFCRRPDRRDFEDAWSEAMAFAPGRR